MGCPNRTSTGATNMSKTPNRIQTSMRFKPETLKILDRYADERAIPRTYLMEQIIAEYHRQQQEGADLRSRVERLEAALVKA